MRAPGQARSAASLLILAGCMPRLSANTIAHHPVPSFEPIETLVVKASAPKPPAWVRGAEEAKAGARAFLGQASGASLEQAEKEARADLSRSLARFVSVEVEAEFEASESEKDGASSSKLHSENRAHASEGAIDVAPDALYWEQLEERKGEEKKESFRAFVHATVTPDRLVRARLLRQIERAKRRRQSVVLVLSTEQTAARARVIRRLTYDGGLFVPDARLLGGVSDPKSAVELGADLVVVMSGSGYALRGNDRLAARVKAAIDDEASR